MKYKVYVICNKLPELPQVLARKLIEEADFVAISFEPICQGDIIDPSVLQGAPLRLPTHSLHCVSTAHMGKVIHLETVEQQA